MVPPKSRRAFLQCSGVGLLALAGCLGNAEPTPDVTVYNERNEEVHLELTIIRIADDVTIFSGERWLTNYETVTVSNPIRRAAEFRFAVTVEGLFEETYDVWFGADDSRGVEVYIQEDGMEFRQVSGRWLSRGGRTLEANAGGPHPRRLSWTET